MVRGDQTAPYEGGEAGPNTGNKTFDRKWKRHSEAIKDFSVRSKSGIQNGVVLDRGCSDPLCLILFVVSFLAMFGLAIYAIVQGKPQMFYAPYDASGNMCGFDINAATNKDYTSTPFLYFTWTPTDTFDEDSMNKMSSSGVCVSECPTTDEEVNDPAWWTANCKGNAKESCPTPSDKPYASWTFITYCLPNPTDENT